MFKKNIYTINTLRMATESAAETLAAKYRSVLTRLESLVNYFIYIYIRKVYVCDIYSV